MPFLGTFEYSMDDRGRVAVPPRYRDAFRQGVVLAQGSPDPCVQVYPTAGFERHAQLYMSEPPTRRRGRVARRGVFSRAHEADLDAQGRILVPPALRRYANLGREVIVIGTGECLEIWSPESHGRAMAEADDHLEETLETLEPRP